MFGLFEKSKHQEVSAAELNAMLADNAAVVIDVREVDEFAGGHIPGAINMPLSTFQATKLPDADGKTIVLGSVRIKSAVEASKWRTDRVNWAAARYGLSCKAQFARDGSHFDVRKDLTHLAPAVVGNA